MARIRGGVTIDAPVEEVFDLVADERNEPAYNPRIARAEKLGDGPVEPGSRFLATPRGTGAGGTMTVDVLEYDRPRRLHHRVSSSYVQVDGEVTFEAAGDGTRLHWDWDMRLVGPMRLLSPALVLVGPRWERRNWVGLKHFIESGGR